MVSKAFFTGSKYLVEDSDGRHDFVRYDGERFLAVLSTAGQKILRTPLDADERKADYLKALVRLNEAYFAAREFEADAKGNFFKHDDAAERKFRFDVAQRFSDRVDDLRTFLAAHDALVAAATEDSSNDSRDTADDGETTGDQALARTRRTLSACTDRSISEGWFPTVQSHYYALSPGELVAEGRERRKQRIEGTESSTGIAALLDKPHFEKLSWRDLRRIRDLNRESPGPDPRVWKRLQKEYTWFLARERMRATPE